MRAARREPGTDQAPRLLPYVVLVLLAALPIGALASYAYNRARVTLEHHIEVGNHNAAVITGALVEQDFEHWLTTLAGFARLPEVIAAVEAHDEAAMREWLQALIESKPRAERAFVTDPTGLLWSDFPRAPESLGHRFADRDWFQGLSAAWQPYVSRVYQRHAEPRLLLVAVAVPVRRHADGPALGAIVCQLPLENLTSLLQNLEVGTDGFVFLVDHGGTVAAHPRLALQTREYDEFAASAPVLAALHGETGTLRYFDPLAGEEMLANAVACEVRDGRWTVVAQQPVRAAYRAIAALRWRIVGVSAVLAILGAGVCFGLARFHNRLQASHRTLEAVNQRLAAENAQRMRAEQELQRSHAELEERVAERTRELQQKEEQLRHAQKLEAVGRLAGGVAHDFNNLLSVIMGYGELALKGLPADAPSREEIQEILSAGERASALTRQLLAFSRKQVLQPEVVDLNRVVARMEKLVRRTIGEDVEVVTALAPGLPAVRVDPGQIEQIVLNLVLNARDAMPQGGRLTLATAAVALDQDAARRHDGLRAGPHVRLAIEDTGVGMDEATRARIFEPFFTTKELGRGTGLGLSSVYGIVKQSGGSVTAASAPGRGTRFEILFPSIAETPAPAPPKPPRAPAEAGTGTILLVEDEPSLRTLFEMLLRSAGYVVISAGSAEEALPLVETHAGELDLLLTDVILLGRDGAALAKDYLDRHPRGRVLFMSGYTDDVIVHHGVLVPGTAFLEKPVRPATLLETVRALLMGAVPPA
jgi:signal transduction histidine kinase